MKKALFLISALVLAATQAHANEHAKKYFLKVEAGGSFPTEMTSYEHYEDNKPKNGAVFGFGAGFHINKYLSADASFNHFPYHKFDKILSVGERATQKFSSSTLMFNMTGNIVIHHCITPFINAGFGFAHNNAGDYRFQGGEHPEKTKDSFAWNIGAGASFKINQWFTPYITYKFFNLGKMQTESYTIDQNDPLLPVNGTRAIKSHIKTHTAMLGLMYNF